MRTLGGLCVAIVRSSAWQLRLFCRGGLLRPSPSQSFIRFEIIARFSVELARGSFEGDC